jgi:hypothetical protein
LEAFSLSLPAPRRKGQPVFIFQHENTRTGTFERFVSPVIPKDKITLSFYFDRQRQTTLYVNKTDRSHYYFDLKFLAGG